ncbi:alanine--tRNA ligase [Porphyromonas cangingivalis]|uniref:alanine--tRNA ligase n=1 Tax=Porphyromonas cangingivalis TaxID=36874 RepID=UPI00242CF3A3|nr:alanine--tRNA ligase [Porphyromonas cangingivalis]
MYTSKQIRQLFLDFFKSKGHHIVPSAPMVIKDDPTLMFTNAGMNQFKDVILGNTPIKYPRVADSQKCLRVSGKHNDLEEVGRDTYHHTMFEMLGNWSFGDYFKKEAIEYAWELLVDVYKLDPDRLYVTVFEGAPEEGLERDNEAEAFWRRVLPADRIINGNKKDNFWEMGDTGPCGPCSEIHIDLRSDAERAAVPGVSLVNHDHPQVIEIWNLVFMQYNRMADGRLEALPNKVIDTGMGFERLCMALQGKTSNYDTDVFTPMISAISSLVHVPYGHTEAQDIAMRVIADHIRTIAFSITDGQLPSNAKAGYVIRRILRRAVRYGYTFLGQKQAFVYKLVPVLLSSMGEAYPELVQQEQIITKVIKEEEESFLRTLETGIHILDSYVEKEMDGGKKSSVLPGSVLFELYDTYGFPVDLTELILREKGLTADVAGFETEMQKQKERARNAAAIEADDWVMVGEGDVDFVGYDHNESKTHIVRYRKIKKKGKDLYQVILTHSPFYAEMGGQIGDRGELRGMANQEVVYVEDTVRENNLPIHIMTKLPADLTQEFHASIDSRRRRRIECNHSATHLMHLALRQVLGTHVEQKGSFVSDEVLRFDFSHFSKMTREEIRKVENLVSDMIRANFPIDERRCVPMSEAKEMGAMALFGEKYGEEVRVIRFGDSIELCGGTHVPATGVIGSFRIVSESSIAAGIRRIEAVTGEAADAYNDKLQDLIYDLQGLFQNSPNLKQAVQKLISEDEQIRKELREAMDERKERLKKELLAAPKVVGDVHVYVVPFTLKADIAKDIAFAVKAAETKEFVYIANSIDSDKCTLTLMLSEGLVAQGHNASNLVRAAGKFIQGGGGGQPAFATAGGKRPEGLSEANNFILAELGLQ